MKLAVIAGDGIGKEVTAEGKKVLEKIADVYGHTFEFGEGTIGHDAIESTGTALPDETLTKLKSADAILFGELQNGGVVRVSVADGKLVLQIEPRDGGSKDSSSKEPASKSSASAK